MGGTWFSNRQWNWLLLPPPIEWGKQRDRGTQCNTWMKSTKLSYFYMEEIFLRPLRGKIVSRNENVFITLYVVVKAWMWRITATIDSIWHSQLWHGHNKTKSLFVTTLPSLWWYQMDQKQLNRHSPKRRWLCKDRKSMVKLKIQWHPCKVPADVGSCLILSHPEEGFLRKDDHFFHPSFQPVSDSLAFTLLRL